MKPGDIVEIEGWRGQWEVFEATDGDRYYFGFRGIPAWDEPEESKPVHIYPKNPQVVHVKRCKTLGEDIIC